MWWNVWPWGPIMWSLGVAPLLDIVLLFLWVPQIWFEFIYNAYKVMNLVIDLSLLPIWLVIYSFQILYAVANRPIYTEDMGAQLKKVFDFDVFKIE